MNGAISWLKVALIVLASVVAGCASMGTGGGNVIGTLRVSGPNVFLNGTPGRDGESVFAGSSVTTGPGSSALVEFRGGGFLQMDEDTDPVFDWIEQSKCILIRLLRGQAYLKRERACVEGPNISMVLNSEANIRTAGPDFTEVTLFKGSADLSAPAQMRLLPGQQLTVGQRRGASLRVLSPGQLRAVAGWRTRFIFPPPPAVMEPFPPPVHRRPHQPSTPRQPETPPATSGEGSEGTITAPQRQPGGYREIRPYPTIKNPEPVIK